MKNKRRILQTIVVVCLMVLFNNCGQGFKALTTSESSSSLGTTPAPTATTTPQPATATPTVTTTPRPTTPTPVPGTPRPATPTATPSSAVLVAPQSPSCRSYVPVPPEAPRCVNSPTENLLKGFACTANNFSPLTNASPCSQRYPLYWKMDLRASDEGRNIVDVLRERHGSIMTGNRMYCDGCSPMPNLTTAITVEPGPGGRMSLQRNIEVGIVPSSFFEFNHFPQGTNRICISLEIYIPTNFLGNEATSYKLGYGVWGGDRATGGGTSPVVQKGFVVRNVWNGSQTQLYSYHLNRGGSGRWAQQNESKCDSNTCCIYGDTSAAGQIPRGRWVRVEEEVVLNTFNKPDGYARLWVDGKQAGEITNMLIYEKDRNMKLRGLFINDMWGGSITAPNHQAQQRENYWLSEYTVYH